MEKKKYFALIVAIKLLDKKYRQMGGGATVRLCSVCNKQEYCEQCRGCAWCNPVRNCKTCLYGNPKNITINIEYSDFKKIYKVGKITKIQGKASKGASKVPFFGKNLHHFFIQMEIDISNGSENAQNRFICIVEGSRRSGNMQMEISVPKYEIRQTFGVYVPFNQSFKDFYNHIRQNEHQKPYGCFDNNCYHVGLRLIRHLYPQLPMDEYKRISQYKDEVISKIWD